MKAIATADLHIDINNRFEDTKAVLHQMAIYAIKNNVEQFWILGDIYDKKRPYSSEIVLFHQFVKSLTDHNIEVKMISGNHDIDKYQVSALKELEVLKLPNVSLLPNPSAAYLGKFEIYLGHFLVIGAKLGTLDYSSKHEISLEKILKNNADLYCFSEDTEVLTNNGWKYYKDLNNTDNVATLNLKNENIEYQVFKKHEKQYKGDMIHFGGRYDLLVTPEHRIVYKNSDINSNILINRVDYISKLRGQIKIPVSGKNNKIDYKIDDSMIKLIAWIIAEGHIDTKLNHIKLGQRESNAYKLRNILDDLNFEYTEKTIEANKVSKITKQNYNTFYIKAKSRDKILPYLNHKNIPEWVENLSTRQFNIFLDELIETDGCIVGPTSSHFYTSTKSVADKLQKLLIQNGNKCIITTKLPRWTKKISYCVQIAKKTWATIAPKKYGMITKQKYSGKVWCLTVDNSTLVVRRNGRAMIVGNCLGDVHKPQKLHSNPDVLYVGSPERIDFGERNEIKGFTLVEADDIGLNYKFIPLKTRPMIQIENNGNGFQDPLPDTKEAIVKVKFNITKDQYKDVNEKKIREEIFPDAQSVRFEYNILRENRVRNDNISEGNSPSEAFVNYAKEKDLGEIVVNTGLEIIKATE